MKTNILWISIILLLIWWVYRLLWWKDSLYEPIHATDIHSWILTLSFTSPVSSWVRYEGDINGSLSPSWDSSGTSIPLKWVLGFWYNTQQSLFHFSGTLGWRGINIDYLIENDTSYIRSRSYEWSWSWIVDPWYSIFIDQLFGKLTDTNYQFVKLEWYNPYRRIANIISPQTVLRFLSEYLTIAPWWCTHKSCDIIIDTDFLTPWVIDSTIINTTLANYISTLWSYHLSYNHNPTNITIHDMDIWSHHLQGVISNTNLSLQLAIQWIRDTLYHITHSIDHNTHIIDFDIDQEWEKTQSWRSSYKIFPDGFSAQLYGYSLDQQTISLSWERYRIWSYLPIEKGVVISIYGLLWGQ